MTGFGPVVIAFTTSSPSFATIVGIVFPILTIVAGGVAILAYGSNKVLRDTAADLRTRIEDLESERDTVRAKADSASAELKVWQKAVTGEVQLAAILDLLGDHHREAVQEWAKNRAMQGELVQTMKELSKAIADRNLP